MLFVKFLDIETEGAVKFVPDPPWPVIELAIRGLNGTTHSLVCLEGIPPIHMNIAGGDGGRYVVSISGDAVAHYILQNPGAGPEIVEFSAAGERQWYPVAMLVPLDWALRAAQTFETTGQPDPTLPWHGTEDLPQPHAESVKEEPAT